MKEITKDNAAILYALCLMWNQYCPSPNTHHFMTAGEQAEIVLQEYGLLNGDNANDELIYEKFSDYIKV